jgi:hypothetical protein
MIDIALPKRKQVATRLLCSKKTIMTMRVYRGIISELPCECRMSSIVVVVVVSKVSESA